MSLLVLHKVLVACTGLFFFFFGVREIVRDGEQNSPIIAVICLVLGVGCAVYFAWVIRGGYTWNQKKENE